MGKIEERIFWIVEALEGDSTITRDFRVEFRCGLRDDEVVLSEEVGVDDSDVVVEVEIIEGNDFEIIEGCRPWE